MRARSSSTASTSPRSSASFGAYSLSSLRAWIVSWLNKPALPLTLVAGSAFAGIALWALEACAIDAATAAGMVAAAPGFDAARLAQYAVGALALTQALVQAGKQPGVAWFDWLSPRAKPYVVLALSAAVGLLGAFVAGMPWHEALVAAFLTGPVPMMLHDLQRARTAKALVAAADARGTARCEMTCPHGDRCTLAPHGSESGCNHKGCGCNAPNTRVSAGFARPGLLAGLAAAAVLALHFIACSHVPPSLRPVLLRAGAGTACAAMQAACTERGYTCALAAASGCELMRLAIAGTASEQTPELWYCVTYARDDLENPDAAIQVDAGHAAVCWTDPREAADAAAEAGAE